MSIKFLFGSVLIISLIIGFACQFAIFEYSYNLTPEKIIVKHKFFNGNYNYIIGNDDSLYKISPELNNNNPYFFYSIKEGDECFVSVLTPASWNYWDRIQYKLIIEVRS